MDMFVLDCFDSIAIFLSIHIVCRFQDIMHKRKVPALDKWVLCWNSIFDLLSFIRRRILIILLRADTGKRCWKSCGPDLSTYFKWTFRVSVIVIHKGLDRLMSDHIMWVHVTQHAVKTACLLIDLKQPNCNCREIVATITTRKEKCSKLS